MATANKICRVCGKEYEACHTIVKKTGVFRWQEVACSPECGSIYLQRVNESRGIVAASQEPVIEISAEVEAVQDEAEQPNNFVKRSKRTYFDDNKE